MPEDGPDGRARDGAGPVKDRRPRPGQTAVVPRCGRRRQKSRVGGGRAVMQDVPDEVMAVIPADRHRLGLDQRQALDGISPERALPCIFSPHHAGEAIPGKDAVRAGPHDTEPSVDIIQGEGRNAPLPLVPVLRKDDAVGIIIDIIDGISARHFLDDGPVPFIIPVHEGVSPKDGAGDHAVQQGGRREGRKHGDEPSEAVTDMVCVQIPLARFFGKNGSFQDGPSVPVFESQADTPVLVGRPGDEQGPGREGARGRDGPDRISLREADELPASQDPVAGGIGQDLGPDRLPVGMPLTSGTVLFRRQARHGRLIGCLCVWGGVRGIKCPRQRPEGIGMGPVNSKLGEIVPVRIRGNVGTEGDRDGEPLLGRPPERIVRGEGEKVLPGRRGRDLLPDLFPAVTIEPCDGNGSVTGRAVAAVQRPDITA